MADQHAHVETHSVSGHFVRDVIIGMSDGLTVPFAIAAGLASASAPTAIVVTAGLAEIAAGSISMGLGGYLAAKSEADRYARELAREYDEVERLPEKEAEEVRAVFRSYGLTDRESDAVTSSLRRRKESWVDFMMKFELGLEKPDESRVVKSPLTIAGSYIVAGLIPLSPYMILPTIHDAFWTSVAVTAAALVVFGYFRGKFTAAKPWQTLLQTVLVGGASAAAAFLLAKLI